MDEYNFISQTDGINRKFTLGDVGTIEVTLDGTVLAEGVDYEIVYNESGSKVLFMNEPPVEGTSLIVRNNVE